MGGYIWDLCVQIAHFLPALRYGLPKKGHCSPGQKPSKEAWAAGCTWSVQKRLKTIDQANVFVAGVKCFMHLCAVPG